MTFSYFAYGVLAPEPNYNIWTSRLVVTIGVLPSKQNQESKSQEDIVQAWETSRLNESHIETNGKEFPSCESETDTYSISCDSPDSGMEIDATSDSSKGELDSVELDSTELETDSPKESEGSASDDSGAESSRSPSAESKGEGDSKLAPVEESFPLLSLEPKGEMIPVMERITGTIVSPLVNHKRVRLPPSYFCNGCICGHNVEFRDMLQPRGRIRNYGVTVRPRTIPIKPRFRAH